LPGHSSEKASHFGVGPFLLTARPFAIGLSRPLAASRLGSPLLTSCALTAASHIDSQPLPQFREFGTYAPDVVEKVGEIAETTRSAKMQANFQTSSFL
jgi:hypothetical protein